MEQLDIFGKFIPNEASWCDCHGNWYTGKGVSEAQARYHLVQEIANSGFAHPEFAYRSHKVHIETYTLN